MDLTIILVFIYAWVLRKKRLLPVLDVGESILERYLANEEDPDHPTLEKNRE